jgi:hypothetical protein
MILSGLDPRETEACSLHMYIRVSNVDRTRIKTSYYLILTYATHFDRVKYPLKLVSEKNGIVASAADILRSSTSLEVFISHL